MAQSSTVKGVYFNGRLITIPGAYSMIESTMTSTKTGTVAKPIAILGECTGGEPGVVQFFNEPSVAKKVLKSGMLLKACQKAWNPVSATKVGVELGGANLIAVIRTNMATKGRLEVLQAAAQNPTIGRVVTSRVANSTGTITASAVVDTPVVVPVETSDTVKIATEAIKAVRLLDEVNDPEFETNQTETDIVFKEGTVNLFTGALQNYAGTSGLPAKKWVGVVVGLPFTLDELDTTYEGGYNVIDGKELEASKAKQWGTAGVTNGLILWFDASNPMTKTISFKSTTGVTVTIPVVIKAKAAGEYTGATNATLKVIITSDGTTPKAQAKYMWGLASQDEGSFTVNESTANALVYEGVQISFSEGTYSRDDSFYVPLYAGVTTEDVAFTIQSKDWGAAANSIQTKMSNGTLVGTRKLTVYNSKQDNYESYDNLGGMFSIKYTGTQPYAVLNTLLDGNGKAIRLQTLVGADAATAQVDLDFELDAKVYKSVKSLVVALSAYENYSVELYPSYNPDLSVNDIDLITDAVINTGTGLNITGVVADLSKLLSYQSNLVEAVYANRENIRFNNWDFISMVGGSEGKSPMSWVEYFEMLSRYNLSYVTPLTDDMSIIAECKDHVTKMSEEMGKERRMTCGRGNGLTPEQAIYNAMRLDSDRAQYVFPGMYDSDDDGNVKLWPAYVLAAQHAGRAAFLPDGEAATHDTYNMVGIEQELEPEQITNLLNGGVVTFEFLIGDDDFSSSYVRCVQDITTWTNNNDPLYVERAIGATADNLNKDLRKTLDNLLVGKRTVTATLTTARNTCISIFKQRVKAEIIVAYKDVIVYKSNGAVWVEYSVAPSEPTNFVLIQGHFYSENLEAITEDSDQITV